MATEIIRPDGDIQIGSWWIAALYPRINDQSDITFITADLVETVGIVTFPTPAASPSTITDFKIRARIDVTDAGPGIGLTISLGGTGGIPDLTVDTHPVGTKVWYESNGSGAPLPGSLDSLTLTFDKSSFFGEGGVDIFQTELVITYTPSDWEQDAEPGGSWAQDAEPA